MSIEEILAYLNAARVRCTYGAVGKVIGCHPISVGRLLGERCKEASWVVNARTEQPTGYTSNRKHPQLKEKDHIIMCGAELVECMRWQRWVSKA